jgi:MFS family permease
VIEALRTPMFWAVAGAVAATGMIGTGLAFHQIDLLGEQGLTPVEAAANFLPQTVAALLSTLLVGSMVDRFAPRWVLLTSMLLLAGAMIAVPLVSSRPRGGGVRDGGRRRRVRRSGPSRPPPSRSCSGSPTSARSAGW